MAIGGHRGQAIDGERHRARRADPPRDRHGLLVGGLGRAVLAQQVQRPAQARQPEGQRHVVLLVPGHPHGLLQRRLRRGGVARQQPQHADRDVRSRHRQLVRHARPDRSRALDHCQRSVHVAQHAQADAQVVHAVRHGLRVLDAVDLRQRVLEQLDRGLVIAVLLSHEPQTVQRATDPRLIAELAIEREALLVQRSYHPPVVPPRQVAGGHQRPRPRRRCHLRIQREQLVDPPRAFPPAAAHQPEAPRARGHLQREVHVVVAGRRDDRVNVAVLALQPAQPRRLLSA